MDSQDLRGATGAAPPSLPNGPDPQAYFPQFPSLNYSSDSGSAALHLVVRSMAWAALCYAVLRLLQSGLIHFEVGTAGFSFGGVFGSGGWSIGITLSDLLSDGATIVIMIASFGALQLRSSSRKMLVAGLITVAIGDILFTSFYIAQFLSRLSGNSMPWSFYGMSIARNVVSILRNATAPALLVWVFTRPAVRTLFHR